MVDTMLEMPVVCVGTAASTIGATCALNTTLDALIPGLVREGDRSIWQLGQIVGPGRRAERDRVRGGLPEQLRGRRRSDFLRQGIFVP